MKGRVNKMSEPDRNLPATGGTTMPSLGGEQSLNRYLAEIKKFPVLTAEQEYMLAKRWREHNDVGAAHRLVTSHLRLVAKIAIAVVTIKMVAQPRARIDSCTDSHRVHPSRSGWSYSSRLTR